MLFVFQTRKCSCLESATADVGVFRVQSSENITDHVVLQLNKRVRIANCFAHSCLLLFDISKTTCKYSVLYIKEPFE
jgi:hypothetical protein